MLPTESKALEGRTNIHIFENLSIGFEKYKIETHTHLTDCDRLESVTFCQVLKPSY